VIPREAIAKLQEKSFFYVWNERASEVRWLASWDTTPDDIRAFAAEARKILA
jgi:threonine aldolase